MLAGCGLFADREPRRQPPQERTAAAERRGDRAAVWDEKIADSGYRVDGEAVAESAYASHADRIGAGQIEQLAMAGPSSAPKIAAFLADPSPRVRAKAVEVLSRFGREAEPGLPRVVEVAASSEPDLRLAAVQALAGIASPRSEAALERAERDRDARVRAWAHAGLAAIGEDCADHQEEIAEILRDGRDQTPPEAAAALVQMDCRAPDALAVLIEAAGRDDATGCRAAARALGHFGRAAGPAVPQLMKLLATERHPAVRLAAVVVLARIGPAAEPAVSRLAAMLEERAPRLRQQAARALGRIGPAARSATAALRKATRDSEATVQAAARNALARIRAAAAPAQ